MPPADRPHPPDPRLYGGDRLPLLGDGKYGKGNVNRRYHETRQALYSYKLRFDFPTDAGTLNYLKGKEFTVENVPFREKYFPQEA